MAKATSKATLEAAVDTGDPQSQRENAAKVTKIAEKADSPEMAAMRLIVYALEPLSPGARIRVLKAVAVMFDIEIDVIGGE